MSGIARAVRVARSAFLLAGVVLAAASAGAQDVKLGKPVDYPNAGIQIAFPQGLEPAVSVQPACLASRLERDANDWKMVCTLSALPIQDANRFPGVEKMAQSVVDDFVRSKGNVISDRLASAETKVQDRPGWRLVARIQDQNKAQEISVVSVWTTDAGAGRPGLCYLVLCRSRGGDANGATAVAEAVCGSAKAIPVVSGAELGIAALGALAESREQGFSFRVPEGWHVSGAGMKGPGTFQLSAGIMDYSSGGRVPNFNLIITAVEGNSPVVDQQLADKAGEDIKRLFAAQKSTTIAARVVRLAGLPAVEWTGTSEIGSVQITQITTAARQTWARGRRYTLTMTVLGQDEKRALDLLDKITAEFRLPGTGAASQESPKTAPAASGGGPAPAGK